MKPAVEPERTFGRIAEVILSHAAKIASEQHIPMLIQLNADLARDLTSADRCSLWLLDKERGDLWTKVAHGSDMIRIAACDGIVGRCVGENRTVIVNDVSTSADFLQEIDKSTSYRTESILCVPVRTQDEVIGALQVLNKPGGFSESDAELLQFLAVYAASAIESERLRREAETARLLRRELDIAREVQRCLFPQDLTAIPYLDYAALCRPARSVGGDYYDLLDLPDGRFGLTLGDVSGKGVSAALLMASIHTLLRSLLLRDPLDLPQVVGALNHAVRRSSASERYSTLFCGVFNADRSELDYVNAGQIPPLVLRADGNIEMPPDGDPPVGLLPGVCYNQHKIRLGVGDVVVCFSDGIVDLDEAAGEWGVEDIESELRRRKDAPSLAIAEALVEAVDRRAAGAQQFDDMTVIVARRLLH
jgi:phosphoserine phosphatase RsbU/P